MRPLIGVSAQPQLITKPYATLAYDGVVTAYTDAIRMQGGLPVVIPLSAPGEARHVLEAIDGLVLSGGGDVDSQTYAPSTGHADEGVDPRRDAWEFALTRAALDMAVPLLGICRGLQVMCVAAGGSLDPHVGAVHPAPSPHLDPGSGHPVRIVTGSLLHDLAGSTTLAVNSLHHQAVRTPGAGQRPTAWAPDGTLEALEAADPRRIDAVLALGVQWHPELLLDRAQHRRLFAWIVEAARRRTARCPPAAADRPLGAPGASVPCL